MKKRIMILGALMITVIGAEAKYSRIRSERSFNDKLDENSLVVVMFYHGDQEGMDDQRDDFKDAGRGDKYVRYLGVNLDREDLASLGSLYGVKTTPAFLLMRNGVIFKQGGRPVMMVGRRSTAEIGDFVRSNFDRYISRKRRRKERDRRESRPSVSFGIGSGPYYGYPYYGYPYYGSYGYPYYRRPGFSFGIGF